jgi:hypothetical protein
MGSQQPWVIANFETIDGEKCMVLNAKCQEFKRFIAGASAKFRNNGFLDSLRWERSIASIQARLGSGANVNGSYYALRKQRKRASRGLIGSPTVSIALPGFDVPGEAVESVVCTMKASLNYYDPLRIRMDADVLNYIRIRMQLKPDDPEHKKRTDSGVAGLDGIDRWAKNRKAFIAHRKSEHGKRVYKTFRHESTCELEISATREKARSWADNADGLGDAEGDACVAVHSDPEDATEDTSDNLDSDVAASVDEREPA